MTKSRPVPGLEFMDLDAEGVSDLEAQLAYLLDLRRRANPAGRAIIDRGLALIARSVTADPEVLAEVRREMRALADDLAVRFGAPSESDLH
jgi:hypothetical protein